MRISSADSRSGWGLLLLGWTLLHAPAFAAAVPAEAEAAMTEAARLLELSETRPAQEQYRRALSLWREAGDRRGEARALEGLGRVHRLLGENETARQVLEQALPIFLDLADRSGEASTRNLLCLLLLRQGEWPEALACYAPVLELARRLAAAELEADVLSNLGGVHSNLGEAEPAAARYREALAVHRAAGNLFGEGRVLNNLAFLHQSLGELEEALLFYGRALGIFRRAENRYWRARTLNNLGFAHLGLGDPERARSYLLEALPLRREVADAPGEATTLRNLGRAAHRLGDASAARDFYRQALEKSQSLGDRRGQATALRLLGEATDALGDPRRALSYLDRSLELQRAIGDRREEAEVLERRGTVRLVLGEGETALADLEEALELRRAVRDPAGEVRTLYAAARAERRLGRSAAARGRVETALALLEDLRAGLGDPSRKALYLASQRGIYELAVELWMELHRADPAAGHERTALELSERARARTLLEQLTAAGVDLRRGVDPGLVERRRSARRRVDLLARRLGRDAGAEASYYEALLELENAEAEIRRASRRYAALTRPEPVSTEEIRSLLDADTLLLEYALGEERTFLWAVTADTVESFELPGLDVLEPLVRQAHADLSLLDLRTGRTSREATTALAQSLLAPVAERLGDRRLVVVADGVLHYVPFAALPDPRGGGEPLLLRHEVVLVPSASALAFQRRQLAGRPRAAKTLAVLADPVFDAGDPRLASVSTPAAPAVSLASRAARDLGFTLDRLPATRREAEAIAALVPPGERLLALGFEARRSLLVDGELASYRILHFATHGLVNPHRPELSGLVLSHLDASGEARDGFLRLADVYDLELGAELVVLSGCRTALGREVRGEGLVGLTRGFLYAGVPRVVASLWQVQDEATAELMRRFYAAMLADGERPAAALRSAQLSIRRERRWSDPFFWGAFFLQGDWR